MILIVLAQFWVAVTLTVRGLLDFNEDYNCVLLNDRSGIRIYPDGVLSPIDLTFVTSSIPPELMSCSG